VELYEDATARLARWLVRETDRPSWHGSEGVNIMRPKDYCLPWTQPEDPEADGDGTSAVPDAELAE
jgi:hypothetical protein